MKLLSVAILEDNKPFLKELIDNLKRTELVNIVVAEENSEVFIDRVREKRPEALFLDIHLKGESTNGIEVAAILKLPVLFLSGVRTEKDYLARIDELKTASDFPVEQHGKVPDTEKLKALLKIFIPRVREYQKTKKVEIKPKGEDEMLISPSDVSFIETVKGTGNHRLNFFSQKPIETADTTFDYFRSNGFPEDKFYKLGKSFLVNISSGVYENGTIRVDFKNSKGVTVTERLEVPTDKKTEIRKVFQR